MDTPQEMPTDFFSAALAQLNLPEEQPKEEAPQPDPTPAPVETPPEVTPLAPTGGPLAEIEEKPPESKLPIDDDEPEEAPPAGEQTEPKDKAGYRIQELKSEIKSYEQQIAAERQAKAQLESQVAELKAKADLLAEMEQKVQSYEDEMSVVRLEKTQPYQEQVAKPIREIITSAIALADKYSIDSEELLEALEMSDQDAAEDKINELISGLELRPSDLTKVFGFRDKVQPLLAKRNEMFSRAEEVLREVEVSVERDREREALSRAEERRKVVPTVADRVSAKLPFLKDVVDTLKASVAETDLDALDTSNKAYNHLAGLAIPKMAKMLKAVQSERDGLLDELDQLRKTLPNLDGGFTPSMSDSNLNLNDFTKAVTRQLALR
jgi:hypothetical protein